MTHFGFNNRTNRMQTVTKSTGPKLNHALLAEANREYVALVDAATKHPAADGRRVLEHEHCALKANMDAYRHEGNHQLLRATIDEAKRTRGLWT